MQEQMTEDPRPKRPMQRVVALRDLEVPLPEGVPPIKAKEGEFVMLPKAQMLQLLTLGAVRLAPIPVRFEKSYGCYNPGELAGFPPVEAAFLVRKIRVASYEKDYQESLRGDAPRTSPNIDVAQVENWREAVSLVKRTSNLDQLEAWMDTDKRPSVQQAILERLEELT